jgi:probable F420-dependent oxidoreductase
MKCILLMHTQKVDLGPEFASGAGVMEIARAAEAAGFEAVAVTDHPIPQDEWMRSGGHHALDPFVALSFAAAATSRLRLLTYIYVLSYRNPFLSAKAAASLDVLSGGRFIFGIAAGYLEPEFEALGVPFAERSALTDEAIEVMKRTWAEAGLHVEGRHFVARGHTALPRPVQQPHPPIWVGGNSKEAIRRAVTLGDGWMPIYNPPEFAARRRTAVIQSPADIRARLDYAAEVGAAAGRTKPLDVLWTAQGLARFGTPAFERDGFLAHVAELRAAGVTHLVVNLPASTRAEHGEKIARFGRDVLARMA